MANNYVTETKDSFKGKTTVESYKLNYQLNPRKLTLSENADFSIRHVSTPTIEGLLIDVHFRSSELNKSGIKSGSLSRGLASYAGEWAFLRNGELIIQIDGKENIPLTPHESDSDVTTNGLTNASACEELVWYEIDKDILSRICNAKSVMMQLSGSKGSWTIDGYDFIFLAKTFWNGFYDSSMYTEEIQHSEDVSAQREAIKKKGCMIEIAIAVLYLILFYALDFENNESTFNTIVIFILLAAFITVAVVRRKKANKIQ
jgi:hypothetical protein